LHDLRTNEHTENDAQLVRVGANSVTIIYEGNKKELELASGAKFSKEVASALESEKLENGGD